jgi:TRAP-type C4-dicarboxylate transport system permease small subunit
MFKKLLHHYCQLLSVLMVACLAVMVVMVFGNVVLRYGFNSGIEVSEEMSRWLFLWLIFMGSTIAVHEQSHMGTDMLVAKLPPTVQKVAMVLAHLLMLWVTWLMAKGSLEQTKINWDVEAPVTGLSMAWAYSPGVLFAVSSGIMLLSDLWYLVQGKLTPAQLLAEHHAQEKALIDAEAAHADHAARH